MALRRLFFHPSRFLLTPSQPNLISFEFRGSVSVPRLQCFCSSSDHQQVDHKDDLKENQGNAQKTERLQIKEDGEEEENNGEYVNPVTGERGGPKGPEPTRYGDWERGGRCSDF
eukprot:TRINITY_DN30004_c0_g1_i1.p1 TRINITY_DN30004_c0_g1~~TRINITY_DN30004_c0_g1_i1.p1  ORF type:complete len:114 (-),score=13.72 TRINITY_DN30004_c0_g1_i1:236-577(-)